MARHPRISPDLRWPIVALTCTFTLAIAAAAFADHSTRMSQQNTPAATVRDFLTSAVVNNDGFTACRYLTPRARASFEGRHLGTGQTCESYFGDAALTLGGLHVETNAQLQQLAYRVVALRTGRLVVVSHGGQSLSFLVRRADATDLNEFMPPPTDWRIDSSVAALGSPASTISRGL